MDALQDYFDFVMQYAPYFYYIPGSGVDPEWGRGPAAAARGGSLQKLIAMEWEVIDEIWALAKAAGYDKHRGLYYQSLASHARTLMQLLKMGGATGKEGEDLARLLQKMTKKVRKFLRDDKAWRRRLRG